MAENRATTGRQVLAIAGIAASIMLIAFGLYEILGYALQQRRPLYSGAELSLDRGGMYSIHYQFQAIDQLRGEPVEFTFVDHDRRAYVSSPVRHSTVITVGEEISAKCVAAVRLPPGTHTVESIVWQGAPLPFGQTGPTFFLTAGRKDIGWGFVGVVGGAILLVTSRVGYSLARPVSPGPEPRPKIKKRRKKRQNGR